MSGEAGGGWAPGARSAAKAGHGSWYLSLELPAGPGARRRRIRRGGFPAWAVAEQALARLRMPVPGVADGLPVTVG